MREIKFRGQRVDTKEWVYGYLVKGDENSTSTCYILTHGVNGLRCEVIPKTVGQFTGLKDSKGKDVYEGDVLHGSKTSPKYEVRMNSGEWSACYKYRGNGGTIPIYDRQKLFEIIGTIHDTPSLLEVGK